MVAREGQLLVLAVAGFAAPAACLLAIPDQSTLRSLVFSVLVSALGFAATTWLIPLVASKTLRRGICGKDLNKRGTPAGEGGGVRVMAVCAEACCHTAHSTRPPQLTLLPTTHPPTTGDTPIPEAAGLAPAAVFLLVIITFELIHYYDINSLVEWVGAGFRGPLHLQLLPDAWLVDYNAALATICFMVGLDRKSVV